jgi:hypothetical protein
MDKKALAKNLGIFIVVSVMLAIILYTLFVSAATPVISSLTLSPNTGGAKIGDNITLTIDADAIGYLPGVITVNGKAVTNFTDMGDTTYVVIYTVAAGDTDRTSGNIPASVVLNDGMGNDSALATTVAVNTLSLDANRPSCSISLIEEVNNPGLQYVTGTTVYYSTGASPQNGTFNVTVTSTDTGSGVANVVFPATVSTGATISSAPYFIDYNWNSGNTLNYAPATITCSDNAGNTNTTVFNVYRDNTSPTWSSVSIDDYFVKNGTTITITSDAADVGSGLISCHAYWSTDTSASGDPDIGDLGTDCDGTATVPTSATAGTYYVVLAYDGNPGLGLGDNVGYFINPYSSAITVDLTAPTIGEVTVTPADRFYVGITNSTNTNIYVNATVTDSSGIAGCQYTIDGGSNWYAATFSSGRCTQYINSGISTGSPYTFNIRATDEAGNMNVGVSNLATGDIDNPTVSLVTPAGTPFGANISLAYTPADVGSGLLSCDLYWNYSAGGAVTLNSTKVSPVGSVVNTFNFTGLTVEGTYSWDVACTDRVGSSAWGNFPAHRTFIIDKTAPLVTYYGATPASGRFVNSTWTGLIYVNASDINLVNWTIRLYNASGFLVNSDFNNTPPVNMNTFNEGFFYFNTLACDAANNCNISETRNFTVDTTAPTYNSSLPLNDSASRINATNFSINLYDTSGLANATLHIKNGTGSEINTTTVTLSGATSAVASVVVYLAEGVYSWFWEVFDIIGNMLNTSVVVGGEYKERIDTTAPSSSDNYDGLWHNANYNITLSCTDIGGSGCAYINYSYVGGLNQTYTNQIAIIFDGSYSIDYYAVDNAGNIEAVSSINPKLDKTAPAINSSLISDITDTTATLTVNVTDGLSGMNNCTYSGAGTGSLTLSSGLYTASLTSLTSSTVYTVNATCSDIAGNLRSSLVGFTTASAVAQSAVGLGIASNFVILAKTGISATGATTTHIVGNIGISPALAAAITGDFALVLNGTYATSALVNGSVYAADYAPSTPAMLTTAVSNMQAAYTDANSRAVDATNLGSGSGTWDIAGLTLARGVYAFSGPGNVLITNDLYLSGNSTDVWIFQIPGTLDISANKKVILSGGALAKNVFWAVAGTTTLEAGSTFEGNILAGPGASTIAMQSLAVLNGRALGQTDVTLIANNVSLPTGVTLAGDILPPVVHLIAPLNGSFTNNNISQHSFNVTDANDNVSCFMYAPTDSANIGGLTGDGSQVDIGFVESSQGNVIWTVNCTDEAGNIGSGETWTYTVDTTKPLLVLNGPNAGLITNNNNIVFNITASDSNLANCTRYSDGIYAGIFPSLNNGTPTTYTVGPFADGVYNWSVTCFDLASNSNVSATRNVTIDTLTPQISFSFPTPASGSYINSNTISTSITTNDTNKVNFSLVTYNYSNTLDTFSGTLQPAGLYSYGHTTVSLSDGLYFFNATIVDVAGNPNRTETRNVTLDTTNPALTLNSPANGLANNISAKTLNWSVTDTNFQNCTVYVDGAVNSTQTSASTVTLGFTEGDHNWSISCRDRANNANNSALRTFRVDTITPTIDALGTTVTSSSATVSFNASESVTSGLRYGINTSMTNNMNITSADISGSYAISGLSASTLYYYELTVCDAVLNCVINGTNNFTTSAAPVTSTSGGSTGSAAYATFSLSDIQFDAGFSRDFAVGGGVRFKIDGEWHTGKIIAITADYVTIEVMSEPQRVNLSVGETMKFDVNADGTYDLAVKVNSINLGEKTASVSFNSIIEGVTAKVEPSDTTTPETEKETVTEQISEQFEESPGKMWMISALIVIIVALIVYATVRYSKHRKHKHAHGSSHRKDFDHIKKY